MLPMAVLPEYMPVLQYVSFERDDLIEIYFHSGLQQSPGQQREILAFLVLQHEI